MRNAAILAVLVAACAGSGNPGIYEAVLPAAGGGGERHVRVTLKPDGSAALSSAFSGRPSRFLAEGSWQEDGREITVNLGGARPERIVFHRAGDFLSAREWDRVTWGEKGPGVLQRVR
jgi:hypothetical protein